MKVNISKFFTKGQRIKVEIEPHDTWNMDFTLSWIILPLLLQLKETKQGYPSILSTSSKQHTGQMSFDFMEDSSSDEFFQDDLKKWDEILDKMIWSFKQLAENEYGDHYHHGSFELTTEETQNGNLQIVDLNPGKNWYDHVGHTLHEERIQEGLDLFAKYYRCLWD